MNKKMVALLVILVLLLSACVNIVKRDNSKQNESEEIVKEIKEEKPLANPTEETNTEAQATQGMEDSTKADNYTISLDKGYKSADLELSILGVEEYQSIEGKNPADKAPTGEKYLVVYLGINNLSEMDEYFNYNYVKTNCDGKEIQTTYLLNDPKGYKSIFNTIPANEELQGYLVYRVPEGWQKVETIYTGWKESKQVELLFNVSVDNLKNVN